MLKSGYYLLLLVCLLGCSSPDQEKEKTKELVYEGMSSDELEETLGNPNSINDRGEIFNAETMQKMSVEEWIYDKRTVLLINDTVKNPKFNSNGAN
ncbi:MAG: hypothetical protein AAGC47_13375 [Bacteroidota bacterium]